MYRNLLAVSVALAVSGCMSQSDIQAKYVRSQNLCRVESTKLLNDGDSHSSVGANFSDCMNKAGWHVASPKTGVATNNPPTGSPSTNPSAATAVARTTPPENVKGQQAATANPPSGAPSVKPSAAAAVAPAEPTAIYQPARPAGATAPAYGTGGGRNF